MLLDALVVLIGAGILVSGHGIIGYRCHKWLIDNAPDVASLIPRDAGAVLGILAASVEIWFWF